MVDSLIFIDAGFLSKLSKHLGSGEYIKFKIKDFIKNLEKKENINFVEKFFYTAPPFQPTNPSPDEIKRKENHDRFKDALEKEGIIVREGRCQKLGVAEEVQYKQKEVDVYLAMDLTNVLVKYPNVKKIILISSDSDFVPVIKNLKEQGVDTVLYTYYEKKRNIDFSRSNYLIKSVHKYVIIKKEDLEK